MSEPRLTQQDVQEILNMVESAADVVDFHLKYGDIEVHISRRESGAGAAPAVVADRLVPTAHSPAAVAPAATAAAAKVPVSASSAFAPGMAAIKAPMVGTFYRAPAPGATPFTEVGKKVTPDSVVCIIEVMKLMSSITAGVAGTVREIRVADGEPVQFGQVLIVIEPDA